MYTKVCFVHKYEIFIGIIQLKEIAAKTLNMVSGASTANHADAYRAVGGGVWVLKKFFTKNKKICHLLVR